MISILGVEKKFFLPMFLVFLVGLSMLYIGKTTYWNSGLLVTHIDSAFHIMSGHGFSNNQELSKNIGELQIKNLRLVNENELKDVFEKIDYTQSYPSFERNIGYSVLLATAWSIGDDFGFDEIRILQIILNSFFVIIIYKLIFLITAKERLALFASYLYAFLLPVQFLSSYPSEEIWGIWITVLVIYFLLKDFSYKNMIIVGFLLGIGSYMHELPHVLIKYLPIIYFGYLIYHKIGWKRSIIANILIVLSAYAVLSPYIIRNYSTFGFYFETRFWGHHGQIEALGEFDESFAKLNDDYVFDMAYKKANDLNLTLNPTRPEFFKLLNEEYSSYLKEHPFVEYKNALHRIPGLLKARQTYGFEHHLEIEKFKRENPELKAFDYIKQNKFTVTSVVYLSLFALDLAVKVFGFLILIYLFYKTRKSTFLFLILFTTLIYGGCLINHVEAKYFLTSFIISFFTLFISIYYFYLNNSRKTQ